MVKFDLVIALVLGGDSDALSKLSEAFAKADADWLADFLKALCDHAPLLAAGDDATYQTRVVEAMKPPTAEAEKSNSEEEK